MITLREQAAIAAMQGILAHPDRNGHLADNTATWAVRYADALIAELVKNEGPQDVLAARCERDRENALKALENLPSGGPAKPSLNPGDILCDLRPGEADDDKPSTPDALLLARLKAAEAVCFTLSTYGDSTVARRQLDAWSEAKAAHEAQEEKL